MAAEAVAVPDRGASGQGTGLFHAKDRPVEGYGPPPAVSLTPVKSPRSRLGGLDAGPRGQWLVPRERVILL